MSLFGRTKKQKKIEQEILKPIRLSIIGTPSAGKTFLVYNIFQLLKKDKFIRKYVSVSHLDKGMDDSDYSKLTADFENSFNYETGTRHSMNKRTSPFTEYEYHFNLTDYIEANNKKIELHIRNIPGEMINTFFASRSSDGTINGIFNNFISEKKTITHRSAKHEIKKLLSELRNGYPNQRPSDIEDLYAELCKEFVDYLNDKYNPEIKNNTQSQIIQRKINIRTAPIERNFYSYLFFRTSSDVLICEDMSQYENPQKKMGEIINPSSNDNIGLNQNKIEKEPEITNPSSIENEENTEQEVNLYNQRKFIRTTFTNLTNWDDKNDAMEGKRLYYAFTKFDACINNHSVNYLANTIDSLQKYWEFADEFFRKVYNVDERQFIDSPEIHERIMELKSTQSFISTNPEGYLKHVFFTSSAFDNINGCFKTFPRKKQSNNTENVVANETHVWDSDKYLLSNLPLGVIEFLISIFTRSGFQPNVATYFEITNTKNPKEGQKKFNKLIRIINNG